MFFSELIILTYLFSFTVKPVIVDTSLQWIVLDPTERFLLELNLSIMDTSLNWTLFNGSDCIKHPAPPPYSGRLFQLTEHFMMNPIEHVICLFYLSIQRV
jgi:hypothetical protein